LDAMEIVRPARELQVPLDEHSLPGELVRLDLELLNEGGIELAQGDGRHAEPAQPDERGEPGPAPRSVKESAGADCRKDREDATRRESRMHVRVPQPAPDPRPLQEQA